ncbi:MAG: hypothetical protein ACRC33_26545, partial [Gemmataceae bacterium]
VGLLGVAFTPDGRRVATIGGTTKVWDRATGRQLKEFRSADGEWYRKLAVTPDGRALACPVADRPMVRFLPLDG